MSAYEAGVKLAYETLKKQESKRYRKYEGIGLGAGALLALATGLGPAREFGSKAEEYLLKNHGDLAVKGTKILDAFVHPNTTDKIIQHIHPENVPSTAAKLKQLAVPAHYAYNIADTAGMGALAGLGGAYLVNRHQNKDRSYRIRKKLESPFQGKK